MPRNVISETGFSEKTPILGKEEKCCFDNEDTLYSKDDEYKRQSTDIPKRYVLEALGFFGFMNVYAMRANLSVAMIAMVFNPLPPQIPGSEHSIACYELIDYRTGNNSVQYGPGMRGEFDWDSEMQASILGAFFYGYVVTQIPGGVIAEKFGAKWLYGIGILITSIFTLLTPAAARWSPTALIFVRVIEGLGEGVTYPAMNALIGRWAPKLERSRMASIIYNGSSFGTVVALAGSGLLSASNFLGGWPSVFYVFGALGCVWFIFWIALVYDSPDIHPRISQKELLLIRQGREDNNYEKRPIPWKAILTTKAVWALMITHFGQAWGFYTLLTELPTYLSNILHFNLKENGVLSAFPYLVGACFAIASGFGADGIRASRRFTITTIRKTFNSIAFFVPALCFVLVMLVGCDSVAIIVLFSISMGFNGLNHSGFNVTHVDMSPEFAGTLMGITNCIANLSGFLAPAFVGWVIGGGQTLANWGIVFGTSAALYLVSGIIYDVFGTAERQQWGTNSTTGHTRRNFSENVDDAS